MKKTLFQRFMSLLSIPHRLIKESICDRTSAPSVSAISRLLRGREGDEDDKKLMDGELWVFGIHKIFECFDLLEVYLLGPIV